MEKMKKFTNEYRTLIANIINEVITLLESKELTEFTLFEGCPYDEQNKDNKYPVHSTFWVGEDQEHNIIQKVIKCNGMWGIVLYDTYEYGTHFPQELTARDMEFDCANTLYEFVYNSLIRKKKQSGTLAEVAEKLKQA